MKRTIAVIFGGTNTEHEVSIVSARSIIEHLDQNKYTVIPIYITKQNEWAYDWNIAPIKLSPLSKRADSTRNAWKILQTHPIEFIRQHKVDIVLPVLHGPYGEDGTIQGMFELLHLPYVGCNVLSSALCMDKVVQKQLCLQQGLPIVPFAYTTKHNWKINSKQILQYINNKLTYPLFVKPANQGSSIGVIKVHTKDKLVPAIKEAFEYDAKIIIEQGVDHAREIECAILGNHQPKASVLGEILPSNEFYDYDAKYVDGKSEAKIPADLPAKISQRIQDIALKVFKLLNCSGLARVDFLIDPKANNVFLNELNTMPGFTQISMYPKLWEASGVSYSKLLETLIKLGFENAKEHAHKKTTHNPKSPWHQS